MSLVNLVMPAFQAAFRHLGIPHAPVLVRAVRPEFGDLQCNDFLGLAKEMGSSPRTLASSVVAQVSPALSHVASLDVAGPGYVNVRFADHVLASEACRMLALENLGIGRIPAERIVIDFGGPNVAKPLHVGHLRSFVIGESLRRILVEQGHRVISDIHLGDWGLQIGKLLLGAALEGGSFPVGKQPRVDDTKLLSKDLSGLGLLYKAGSAACDADAASMALARELTRRLQEGHPDIVAAWQAARDVSLCRIREVASDLAAHFDLWLGESDAHPMIAGMVASLVDRGVAVRSDGAYVVPVAGREGLSDGCPPLMLLKGDGAAMYGSTDLATLKDRVERQRADRVIYCTDDRQELHIRSVFAAAKAAGYADGLRLQHAVFGTVRGGDGKPYKTRSGDVASLDDMIESAVAAAEAKLRTPEAAKDVAIGALKFADLSAPRRSGYVFDLDRMTSFEGRTGPYVQYACARIRSIIGKHAPTEAEVGPCAVVVSHPLERALLAECLWYPVSFSVAAETLEPFELANRAFLVADAFSRFYASCPVVGSDQQSSRIEICRIALAVLEKCLHLLGIGVVDRM